MISSSSKLRTFVLSDRATNVNYNHHQKNENLAENVAKFKKEANSLKLEIKKLVKQNKTKLKKSLSVSTNTIPETSTIKESQNVSTNTVPILKCYLNNTSTNKKVCSYTRDTNYSDKLIPLGPVLDNSSVSEFSPTSSMVAHWTPLVNDSFQNPSSLLSMVTHCAKLPNPGDKYLTNEEFITEMKKWLDDFWKNY